MSVDNTACSHGNTSYYDTACNHGNISYDNGNTGDDETTV